jgi:TolB-like protein/tetratricopeptide (TPR) repeat protein
MATVYLAQDLKHHRLVALKLLRPELAAALGHERFLREIRIAAQLNHPHILPLHDSGALESQPGMPVLYYAMPYVEGESLRDRLEREKQLPLDDALRITREVADALSYAHEQGVVHRDIKPENLLLSNDHAVVADFGIARALDAAGGERLTETGLALGTPSYMSPEQAAGETHLDGRSDVYALSCVLYEMLAGAPPFTGRTVQAILARHSVDPVPSLRTVRATVPEAVELAIQKALAKVPADRYRTAAEFAEALTVESAWPPILRRIGRRKAGLMIGVAIGVAAMATSATLLLRAHPAGVIPSAAIMAVLPFSPTAPDTALARLGQDLAATLSVTLDGVGDIRTVDRFTVLAQTAAKRGPQTLQQGMALGRRFGAQSVLQGSLSREGSRVRLDATLFRSDRPVPVARVAVTAPPESLSALTDSAAWGVLQQVWLQGRPPSPSLSAVTTRSVSALRAFLGGEQSILGNHWGEAAQAYGRAIAADSAFTLAYYRYAEARGWLEEEIEPRILDQLRRHRNALPERDRLMVDAFLADSLSETLRLFGEVTRRFPDYWPGWFFYGDRLAHFGPLLGDPGSDAREAFRRALALNPDLRPAWMHLGYMSLGQDTAGVGESIRNRIRLGGYPGASSHWNRLLYQLGTTDGVLDSSLTPLADTVARYYAGLRDGSLEFAPEVELLAGFPAAQIDLNRRVLRLGVDPERAAANLRGIALSWGARGAWDSALAVMDRYTAMGTNADAALEAYALAVLGAWFGGLDSEEPLKRRQATGLTTAEMGAEPPGAKERLAWLDGILAFWRRDHRGLLTASAALEAMRSPRAAFNHRSLAAFERALGGDRADAGRELAAQEWQCANQPSCPLGNYDIAVHHLAAAQWLLEAGDTAQAARLLVWHEAWQGGSYWAGTEVLAGLAYLQRARIEESRGSTRLAGEDYQQFLRRYDMPMPAQRHLVDEAKTALVRMASEP